MCLQAQHHSWRMPPIHPRACSAWMFCMLQSITFKKTCHRHPVVCPICCSRPCLWMRILKGLCMLCVCACACRCMYRCMCVFAPDAASSIEKTSLSKTLTQGRCDATGRDDLRRAQGIISFSSVSVPWAPGTLSWGGKGDIVSL